MRSTLGWIGAATMLLGPALAFARLIPGLAGFVLFALGGLLALGVAIASVVQAARGRGLTTGGAAAVAAAVVLVVSASRGAGVPRINDFTTDLADPPAFRHAQILGPNSGRDLGYPPDFAPIQRACCADLHPAHVTVPPGDAFVRAQRLAASMPTWTITHADPTDGILEAVATTRVFGFQDDIVIRVHPDGPGGSRIDVRSKSRDGQGDLGTNAARIRDFVARLEAAG